MPVAKFWGDNLTDAVTNGSVTTERLDDMNTRLLAAYFYLNQNEGFPENAVYPFNVQHPIVDVREDHASLIREIGAAGTVLVKNVNNTLPLRNSFLEYLWLRCGGQGATLEQPISLWWRVRGKLWLEHPQRYLDNCRRIRLKHASLRYQSVQGNSRPYHR
jgi:beta-glucosidase-like glycosyl hydrolase